MAIYLIADLGLPGKGLDASFTNPLGAPTKNESITRLSKPVSLKSEMENLV